MVNVSYYPPNPYCFRYNLQAHHYRNDLKKHSEVEDEKVDVETLPTYIFSKKKDNFEILFELLDEGKEVGKEAWGLINRLPTAEYIFEKIQKLEGIRDGNKEVS